MKQGPRLNRKESEGRLVSTWLGASLVALPAGVGMLVMSLPAGVAGASLIGGWFVFSGLLGSITFSGLLGQARERSPGGNFQLRHFLTGLFAAAAVTGGVAAGMQPSLTEAYNQKARYMCQTRGEIMSDYFLARQRILMPPCPARPVIGG